MIDIKRIRENPEEIRRGLSSRGAGHSVIEKIIDMDMRRRNILSELEALRNRRNKTSEEIGRLKRQGIDTSQMQEEVRKWGEDITRLNNELRDVEKSLSAIMLTIPNVPHATVPVGEGKSANRIVRQHGVERNFHFKPRTHVELGTLLGILDLQRAAKLSGTGFALFISDGARLVRALIQFMLDLHTKEHGYTEVWTPVLNTSDCMTGTGQLPNFEPDMYRIMGDDLFLVPTAEVPLTNYFRDEIITHPLPIRLTAYTPCFRREAGAAGKETRGIIRVHQFDKVELVKFVEPHTSYSELDALVHDAEDVLQKLGLVYRVVELGTGDLGFAAAKCFDLELWSPGQNAWLEVSSCSNFEDFQARRAKIRYKNSQGNTQFVHTLNGSGVALPRLLVALLENNQQADGSVLLPEVLAPYMGGKTKLEPI